MSQHLTSDEVKNSAEPPVQNFAETPVLKSPELPVPNKIRAPTSLELFKVSMAFGGPEYLLDRYEFPSNWSEANIEEAKIYYNHRFLMAHPNTILIKPLTESARQKYQAHSAVHQGDSGLDLFCLEDATIEANQTAKIKFGIACQANSSYWLLPRSSISKTNLRMANSMGLIDLGYRGELMAVVDHIKPNAEAQELKVGDRLFQLALPSLNQITAIVVDFISPTSRGAGGFGSTN